MESPQYSAPIPPPQPPPQFMPPSHAEVQARQDADHLKLLSIGHYVLAGLTVFGSLFSFIYIFLGIAMMNNPSMMKSTTTTSGGFPGGTTTTAPPPNPAVFGGIFVGVGLFILIACLVMVGLNIYAGRCLARHENKTFIQVVAVLHCLNMPLGTILGVFTFVVLSRPTVAALFDKRPQAGYGGPNEIRA